MNDNDIKVDELKKLSIRELFRRISIGMIVTFCSIVIGAFIAGLKVSEWKNEGEVKRISNELKSAHNITKDELRKCRLQLETCSNKKKQSEFAELILKERKISKTKKGIEITFIFIPTLNQVIGDTEFIVNVGKNSSAEIIDYHLAVKHRGHLQKGDRVLNGGKTLNYLCYIELAVSVELKIIVSKDTDIQIESNKFATSGHKEGHLKKEGDLISLLFN